MKLIVYSRFLGVTSFLLNFSVRYGLWSFAKILIEFRKKHIAKTLRQEVIYVR